jgi:hypothetical protein
MLKKGWRYGIICGTIVYNREEPIIVEPDRKTV